MKNDELIRRFEAESLPGGGFHHADHVRLAFAYLCGFPPLEALMKFSAALKRFATARGKPQLYNDRRGWSQRFQLVPIHDGIYRIDAMGLFGAIQ